MTEEQLRAERAAAISRLDAARAVESWRGVRSAASRIDEIDVELAALRRPGPRNPAGRRSVKG